MVHSRLLVAVLATLALASAVAGVVPLLQEPSGATSTAEPSTPVFSLRRAAGPLIRTVAATRLRSDLDGVLAEGAPGAARDHTCLAVSDPDGRSIYEHQLTMPVIPASTTKLVTGAAVLAKLGADTRFSTAVRTASRPQDGSVGEMWLVGSGDPLLATADYASQAGWLESPRPATSAEALADRIVEAGIRRIGRLVGDESRYDTQRYVPTWDATYASVPEVGPQSALTMNDGYVQWTARKIPASSPATHAVSVLANLLRARAVTVDGVGEGKAPEGAVTLATVDSPPMTEVVGVILSHSGNLASELLVKELGARFGGGGSTLAGLGVIRETLAAMGLPADQLTAVDGSGLDRGDRLTCNLLQGLLTKVGAQSPVAQGMPVAGHSGTLIRRFRGTPAEGRVRAKTGSLDEVIGLSGWADGADGRPIQFSLVANELPFDDLGFALQDRLVTVLVSYPEAPAADEIAPGPPRPRPG